MQDYIMIANQTARIQAQGTLAASSPSGTSTSTPLQDVALRQPIRSSAHRSNAEDINKMQSAPNRAGVYYPDTDQFKKNLANDRQIAPQLFAARR